MVPELWKQLKPTQVDLLSTRLFGKSEFIDWRDFIVFTINIPCPDEVELMEARQNFRETDPELTETVKNYQFYSTRLWFEYCFDKSDVGDMKRLWGLKRLLFNLFKVDDETVNYTAFLLRFCKDRNPVIGFAKALQLSLGRRICWQNEVGEAYVERLRTKRRFEEEERRRQEMLHKEAEGLCQKIVVEATDQVAHLCDSVVIEDYISEASRMGGYISEETSLTNIINYLTKQQMETFGEGDSTVEDEQEWFTPSLLLDDRFSNVEIGFEPTEDPPKAFFLPLEAAITVATVAMLPNSTAPAFAENTLQEKIKLIYESKIRKEFNNAVLAHEFLNDDKFVSLLVSSCKFEEKLVSEKVKELVEDVNGCTQ